MPFVRGATPPEGMSCKVAVYYTGELEKNFNPEDEDGSWDLHQDKVFPELRVRKRKVQMMDLGGSRLPSALVQNAYGGHEEKSKLFKPQVSILTKFESLLLEGETEDTFFEPTRSGQNSYMTLNILSDGRRCLVKRME